MEWLLGRVAPTLQNLENAGSVNVTAGGVVVVELNNVSMQGGEFMFVGGTVSMNKGATAGDCSAFLSFGTGSGSFTALGAGIHKNFAVPISGQSTHNFWWMIKCNTTGQMSLIRINASSAGSDSTILANKASLQLIRYLAT